MATNKDVITRIKDLVGDTITDIEGYEDLIASGFNYVADLIPVNSEMWQDANASSSSTSTTFDSISTRKLLSVLSKDANGVFRVCKEVPFEFYTRGEDSSSIYYNAGSYKSPIFSFNQDGVIQIKPTPVSVDIRYFTYLTNETVTTLSEFSGIDFPQEAVYLAILRSCSNLLQARVSQAVQEEEDNELLAILTGQISTIDKMAQEEMQRLGLPFQQVGDGNDIK